MFILRPQQKTGLGQTITPGACHGFGTIKIFVIADIVLPEKFVIQPCEFIKGYGIRTVFADDDFLEFCTAFGNPYTIDKQVIAVQVVFNLQPQADVQVFIIQCILQIPGAVFKTG